MSIIDRHLFLLEARQKEQLEVCLIFCRKVPPFQKRTGSAVSLVDTSRKSFGSLKHSEKFRCKSEAVELCHKALTSRDLESEFGGRNYLCALLEGPWHRYLSLLKKTPGAARESGSHGCKRGGVATGVRRVRRRVFSSIFAAFGFEESENNSAFLNFTALLFSQTFLLARNGWRKHLQ